MAEDLIHSDRPTAETALDHVMGFLEMWCEQMARLTGERELGMTPLGILSPHLGPNAMPYPYLTRERILARPSQQRY